jgi:thiamine-phosphate pyrophosphorylase
MRGLYAIVDLDTLSARGLDPLRFARAVLEASPAALQLRAKHASTEETFRLLSAFWPMCRAAQVPLVANDLIELAVLAGCDMVHLGQEDLSLSMARRVAPTLGVGISTHTPEQLNKALAGSPTYVAFGPVYRTHSKAQPDPEVGLSGLRQAAQLVAVAARQGGSLIPLVAIGGISLGRAEGVAEHADMVAVIGGLLPEGDAGGDVYAKVEERARAYVEAIARGSARTQVAS